MTDMPSARIKDPNRIKVRNIMDRTLKHSLSITRAKKLKMGGYVSVNSNWVHPPRATPGNYLKSLAQGSECDF